MANKIQLFAAVVITLILVTLIDRTYWLFTNPVYITPLFFVFLCIHNFLCTTPIGNLFSAFDSMNSGDRMNNTRQNIKRQMIFANELELLPFRRLGAEHNFWKLVPHSDHPRFTEVAELSVQGQSMEIKGKVKWEQLWRENTYAAYLIFKTKDDSRGLNTLQEASIPKGSLSRKKIVSINPTFVRSHDRSIGLPKKRPDGWLEMKLGKFYCDVGAGEEVIILKDYSNGDKSGLIVAGIEVRPI